MNRFLEFIVASKVGRASPIRSAAARADRSTFSPQRDPQPIALAMVEAARSLGLPTFDSPNGPMMEGRGGAAINDLIVKDGHRFSIYRAYVHPRLKQLNLTVLTQTMVSKLIFDGASVVGVEAFQDSKRYLFMADREVVLPLGAINTPKVLMQSGIGLEEELQRHDIPVIQHLPGVGRNHQDHIAFGCTFEYRKPQEVGYGGSEATLYWKSDANLDRPDMFHCQVEFPAVSAETMYMGVPEHGWTMFAGLAHQSRGSLHLSGPNPDDPMRIEANTLSHLDDLKSAFANIEACAAN